MCVEWVFVVLGNVGIDEDVENIFYDGSDILVLLKFVK